MKDKIKCWVLLGSDEYGGGGMVCRNRNDALEESQNLRECGDKAYVRVKYFTQEELDALPEYD